MYYKTMNVIGQDGGGTQCLFLDPILRLEGM